MKTQQRRPPYHAIPTPTLLKISITLNTSPINFFTDIYFISSFNALKQIE